MYRSLPFKRQAYGLLRGHVRLPRAIYQHLHFEGPFEVRIDHRHRIIMNAHGEILENELFWGGFSSSWEEVSLQVWASLCRAGNACILDIGANTGIYSLTAAALDPKAEVVAFEPLARVAERLKANAAMNGFNIKLAQLGVSDRTGTTTIFDTVEGQNYSASLEEPLANTTSYAIDVTTIDDFVSGSELRRPVELVKIDVEKHEPSVVRGMSRLIETDRPTMLIEILDRRIGEQIGELVRGREYRLFQIDEQAGLIETRQLGHTEARNWNHLICTDERFQAAGLGKFLARS